MSSRYEYEKAQREALLSSIFVATLVRVIRFDPAGMTVDVQPVIPRLVAGEYATPTPILQVPVAGTRGGGYLIRPWYNSGDLGVVLYLDGDMDAAMAAGGEAKPNTERKHSNSDAVFLGGIVAGGWKSVDVPQGLCLATEDGSVSLAITAQGINLKGNLTVDGTVSADNI